MKKRIITIGSIGAVVLLLLALFPSAAAMHTQDTLKKEHRETIRLWTSILGTRATQAFEIIELIILAVIFIIWVSYDYLETMSQEFPRYFVGKYLAMFLYTFGIGMIMLALKILDSLG